MKHKLIALRKARKLRQEDAAKQLVIARSTLAQYETGEITVPAHRLSAMAQLYGVTLDELYVCCYGETSEESEHVSA